MEVSQYEKAKWGERERDARTDKNHMAARRLFRTNSRLATWLGLPGPLPATRLCMCSVLQGTLDHLKALKALVPHYLKAQSSKEP